MNLLLEPYPDQVKLWPAGGRHILAQYDDESIVVYQAYRPSIGHYAAEHGAFGGDFSYTRMSWIKPNFLWMMYRSDWGTKEGQEVTLALRLRRAFFDSLLAQAVPSSWDQDRFATHDEWSNAPRCGCSGIRIIIRPGPRSIDGRSSWDCAAKCWRRSAAANCSR